jgi:4-amino-4-deoxy-L-arabinose transferase-like glycosyltransferase
VRSPRVARILAYVAVAALLAVPWRTHVDDLDAQMYLVIARNIARSGRWFDLSFGPGFWPQFREHLPFGFWPAAAAIRVLGEWAVNPVYALLTLGAVAAAARIARTLRGPPAEIGTVLLLGTCEIVWHYGGRPLLEPPLLFFATASAAAALECRWAAGSAFAALATLVKGPFGLLDLACAGLFRRPLKAAVATAAAVLPAAVFVLCDPGGGWREHYWRAQILGSASGMRGGGIALWWFPWAVIAGRFWPGLPFALAGVWQARRDVRLRPLVWTCLAVTALLCLPARKWGNHTYVVFPLLGALAGCAAAGLVERFRLLPAMVAAVACAVLATNVGARIMRAPCPFSTSLAGALAAVPPRSAILVGAAAQDDAALAELAAERDLDPFPAAALPASGPFRFAVAREGTTPVDSWSVRARGRGWLFLQR